MTKDLAENGQAVIQISAQKRIIVIVGLMLGNFPQTYAALARGVILPSVLSSFNAMQYFSLVLIAGAVSMTLALPISGKLGDLYGRKKILKISMVVYIVACIVIASANSVFPFVAGVFLSGLAYGFSNASVKSIISDVCNAKDRPKILGYTSMVDNATQLVAPLLGGILADTIGWQWVYLICIPFIMLAFFVVEKELPEKEPDRLSVPPTIDFKGIFGFVVTAGAVLLLLSMGGTQIPWFSPVFFTLIGVSLIGGLFLISFEKVAPNPIISFYLFKSKDFTRVFIVSLFAMTTYTSVAYYSVYIQNVCGLSATISGGLMLPRGIVGIIGTIAAGTLIGKLGVKPVLAVELLLLIASHIMMSMFSAEMSYSFFVSCTIVYTLGNCGILIGAMTIVQSETEPKDIGAATSLIVLTTSLGNSLGGAIGGFIVNNVWSKASELIPDVLSAALSSEQLQIMLDQSTLASGDTIRMLRESLSSDLQGIFDSSIELLRQQLLKGISWLNIFCAVCGIAAFVAVLAIGKAKMQDDLSSGSVRS